MATGCASAAEPMGTHVAGGAATFLRLQPNVTLPTSVPFTPDANGAGASDFTRMIVELDKLLCEALPAAPAKPITRRAASSAATAAPHTNDVFISHAFDANYDSDASADRADGTPSCDEGSTAATDHALAGRVQAALKARGWRVALSAHAELIDPEPSHRHLHQAPIRRAIHNSAAVVVVLTEAYLQTCADELDAVVASHGPRARLIALLADIAADADGPPSPMRLSKHPAILNATLAPLAPDRQRR